MTVILDLAAAPGGKTTHIAARMEQHGLLVANDVNASRVRDIASNLERWGARNTIILNETPPRLAAHFGPFFDKVLVDAPCSGEGMFRKDPSAIFEWSPRMIERCASRQDEILDQAAGMVRPGGLLVYATCTFAPEENEGSVLRFLRAHPDFDVEEIDSKDGFSSGRPDWLSEFDSSPSDGYPEALHRALRLWPHLGPGEGHFIAVLRKTKAQNNGTSSLNPLQHFPLTGSQRFIMKPLLLRLWNVTFLKTHYPCTAAICINPRRNA